MFQFLKKQKTSPKLISSFSLFGKLPGMADFTKINAHDARVAEINIAVEDMMSDIHEKSIILDEAFNIQCVFEEADNHLLIQTIHSSDKSGRCYPLTAVSRLEHDRVRTCQPAAPLIIQPVVAFLKGLQEQHHLNSRSALESACESSKQMIFEQTKATLLESEVKLLKSVDQSTFLCSAFSGLFTDKIATHIMNNAEDILSFGQDKCKPITFHLSKDHIMASAVFWLQWIETLLQPKRWPLHYCIVNTHHAAHMHVWFEKPEKIRLSEWIFMDETSSTSKKQYDSLNTLLHNKDVTLCDALYLWKQEVLKCEG